MLDKLIKCAPLVSASAAILSALAALGAVFVAYTSLNRAATQLTGTTIYNLTKDGKALQRRYEKGDATPDEVISYFFSLYELRDATVLDDRAWRSIEISICKFMKSGNNVIRQWEAEKDGYDQRFREFIERLRGKSECL